MQHLAAGGHGAPRRQATHREHGVQDVLPAEQPRSHQRVERRRVMLGRVHAQQERCSNRAGSQSVSQSVSARGAAHTEPTTQRTGERPQRQAGGGDGPCVGGGRSPHRRCTTLPPEAAPTIHSHPYDHLSDIGAGVGAEGWVSTHHSIPPDRNTFSRSSVPMQPICSIAWTKSRSTDCIT